MAAKKASVNGVKGGFKVVAPEGFRKVDTGIAGFWKPTTPGQSVSGIVGHPVEVVGAEGKKNTFFTFKLADDSSGPIRTADDKEVPAEAGLNVGVGGAVLQGFLQEHQGQDVYIYFTGMGVARKGRNAPKLFECFERAE